MYWRCLMKKLRNKVFWVIFLLLTSFTLIIFVTYTTRTYVERKNSISDILTKLPRTFDRKSERKDIDFSPSKKTPDDPRRIYMNFTVYTVILDDECLRCLSTSRMDLLLRSTILRVVSSSSRSSRTCSRARHTMRSW